MQKHHLKHMAEIVRAILDGHWTHEAPDWWDANTMTGGYSDFDATTLNLTRAIQTAEAFIAVCREANPRFDRNRFLVACGLMEKPATNAPKPSRK